MLVFEAEILNQLSSVAIRLLRGPNALTTQLPQGEDIKM